MPKSIILFPHEARAAAAGTLPWCWTYTVEQAGRP